LRILAGSARGTRLLTDRGDTTRPLMGRARTSLFDILQPRLAGSRFLDLFAGFGSVGLEAVSRGAAEVVLVERDPKAAQLIRRNIEKLGFGAAARLAQADVFVELGRLARAQFEFDLIFAGPPYQRGLVGALAASPELPRLLVRGGTLIVQHSSREAPGDQFGTLERVRRQIYGDTELSFYAAAPQVLSLRGFV